MNAIRGTSRTSACLNFDLGSPQIAECAINSGLCLLFVYEKYTPFHHLICGAANERSSAVTVAIEILVFKWSICKDIHSSFFVCLSTGPILLAQNKFYNNLSFR